MKREKVVHMKRLLLPAVLFFGLFSLISPYLHSQDTGDIGFKYLRNYSYKGLSQQRWMII